MDNTAARLIVHSTEPLNAEPPLPALGRSFLTSQALFYVRTHGTIPDIASGYRLRVGGSQAAGRAYTLDELRAEFPVHTLCATLQCAGNRRRGLASVGSVDGQLWDAGAIGNARWTGVRLGDVLRAAGLAADQDQHVEFAAPDEIELADRRFTYRVSIPLRKALSHEVLLAWALNDEPLTREHGAPLRAVVAGYAGVRSAKWVTAINILDRPSDGYMQQHDYKLFPPEARGVDDADWEHAATIDALPLNSAICEPVAHAEVVAGLCTARGYAVAANGARVARVDVSVDGGRTWRQAQLAPDSASPWSWTLWQIELDLSSGDREICVRAWDDAGQTQPARPEDVWNFKGYLNTSWHRVPLRVG